MPTDAPRRNVRFPSGPTECAAWHYRGTNRACVIMAGGFAVTKEPATDRFARRFYEQGFSVLAFDYRRLGESGGQPRLVLPIADQLADWQAAIRFAATLDDVDADKLAIWGFSASGGHVFELAARQPGVAAGIAQTPNADGPAAARNQARHQTTGAMLRFTAVALLDTFGGWLGRPPRLVPLFARPGTVALLTTPDSQDGDRALDPDHRYPDWARTVAARSALRTALYRPGRAARRARCPLLVLVCDGDQTALAAPTVRAADAAPQAELVRLPGGHYEPFLSGHDQAVEAELSFLRRHLHVPAEGSTPPVTGQAAG